MDENELLLILEVVSLFTMIPINEAIQVIEDLTDQETCELVGVCLRSTFFNFQGELYEQNCGVSIEYPLSLIIANLFME